MGKKNDASFEFQTPNMTESIDLCLVLFAFLFSKKNAFKNSDMALPLTKYRYFFKTLYDLSLLKETRFGWDAKYKDLISAVMYDEESEALKDESYFFAALEEVVKIHKKAPQGISKTHKKSNAFLGRPFNQDLNSGASR